jgi:hypothetical protein
VIPGVGEGKAKRFGTDILEAIKIHAMKIILRDLKTLRFEVQVKRGLSKYI